MYIYMMLPNFLHTEGADYQGISTVVTFQINDGPNSCRDVDVILIDDNEFGESLESFQLLASDNSPRAMPAIGGDNATATGLITENDFGKCTHSS